MTTFIIILITMAILAIILYKLYKPIKAYRERKLRLFCIQSAIGRPGRAIELYEFLSKKKNSKLRKGLTSECILYGKIHSECSLFFILNGRWPQKSDLPNTEERT